DHNCTKSSSETVWELGKEGDRQGEIGCEDADTQLSHEPVGCRMGPAGTAVARGTHGAPPTPQATHTGERAALRAADGLRLALAPRGLATLAQRVLLPTKMAAGWHLGAPPYSPA